MLHNLSLLALGLITGWAVADVVRWLARKVVREELVFGDWPNVPEGARQQRAIGGTNSLATDAHNRTTKVIARPHNGSVTR